MWSNPPQDILQTYAKEISDLKIVFLKYVSDEYLRSLYNGATLTMYPSRSEGFGFPILESFACGTPVMTCRNSCLQEIGRDVALYVGEDNVDEMVDVMKYFEKNLFNMELFKKCLTIYCRLFLGTKQPLNMWISIQSLYFYS